MAMLRQDTFLRHGRAALALALAALAPGLGHLSLGRWIKGTLLLAANTVALWLAGRLLTEVVPGYERLSAGQAAALLSPEATLGLFAISGVLLACIFYSVLDVRRTLRDG